MATRRELSSSLKNLKFMKRAASREEKSNKEDEVKPHGKFPANSAITRKCVVIMEGDPHPSALKGRMSFHSFNPSVDKLNEEEARLNQSAAEPDTTIFRNQSEYVSFRENSSSIEGLECSNLDKKCYEANGNVKRKRVEVICEAQYCNKSTKNDQGNGASSSNSLVFFRKPMVNKLDWNFLRPSKCHKLG